MPGASHTDKVKGIYLVGFSGTGKSTVARLIAEKMRWPSCDLDDFIAERSGLSVPLIFQREGEAGFRLREAEALRAATQQGPFVIATGGGTVVPPANRTYMASNGWIVCLEAQASTLLARIQHHLSDSGEKAIRPMLDAVYPLDQIKALKQTRQSAYGLADWTVHGDRLSPAQVADEVIRAVELLERSPEPPMAEDTVGGPWRHSLNPDLPPPITVAAGPWPYNVVMGWNHLPALGENVRRVLPQARRAAILTDKESWQRTGEVISRSLQAVGLEVQVREVPAEETLKTHAEVSAVQDWMLGIRLRRDDIFVVAGGGAVDDIGGFAASTYMRGVALVKVPTSLDGMVDSSIGGKTALNHPLARNLIGTFYHPRLVWADAALLHGEPKDQLRAAWAEVVKYAMLEVSLRREQAVGITLFEQLHQNMEELLALEKSILLKVISRCVALKAQVVAGDERDIAQYRIFLNYGHTIGHALEAATQYELSHGEAVAVGMAIEAALAVRLGLADPEVEATQKNLLRRFGLPTQLPPVDLDLLLSRIHSDKKVFGDAPRWILPIAVGQAIVSRTISEADLIAVLEKHRQ